MKKKGLWILLLAITAVFPRGQAEELDSASTEALSKTQKLLTTPNLRDKAIHESAAAQTVDAQVRALAGNEANTEQIYGLSNEIFADLVKETGGDPVKMQEILSRAKDDPKTFYDHLSEKNRKALHDTSLEISRQPTTNRAPAQKR